MAPGYLLAAAAVRGLDLAAEHTRQGPDADITARALRIFEAQFQEAGSGRIWKLESADLCGRPRNRLIGGRR